MLRSAPLFAVHDAKWNHGEGFAPNDMLSEDFGGWFHEDDGSGLVNGDVHVHSVVQWTSFQWSSPVWNGGAPVTMRRLKGWLRPADAAGLPTEHPRYGYVGSYVDQGAFEMFIPPNGGPSPGQKIAIFVLTRETLRFPKNAGGDFMSWRQIYPGFFSPDGLERWEPPSVPGQTPNSAFLANVDDTDFADPGNKDGVIRPTAIQILAAWIQNPNSAYWPMVAYPVLSVPHRQTTLNEQRDMQILQATKLLLQESTARNPLGASGALTATQVEQRCVVCFAGGSNGGMAAQIATLRYPRLVHGSVAEVINPSYQRLYGEHDFAFAVVGLGAGPTLSDGLVPDDFLHWNQYVWSQGLEMHDMSYLRLFLAGKTYRPALFGVGDEDITSTGVDWARVLNPTGAWADNGTAPPPTSQVYKAHDMSWMIAQNGCHQRSTVPVVDPFSGAVTYNAIGLANEIMARSCAQRAAELADPNHQPPPTMPLQHEVRTAAQQLRGLDDPHEWFLGRLGEALPTDPPPLQRDDAFFSAVQPGATGTLPGKNEAMYVRDGRVYVGSADGFVTAFEVDLTQPKQPLKRVARSARLGHAALTMTGLDDSQGNWKLLVGTRRHLHRLDPASPTLAPSAAPVQLPWEVAQPHHIKVADVLPGNTGKEVVFASMYGGLSFYTTNLVPIYEWPEPGILDFAIQGGTVTILSTRNMLANVVFSGPNHTPTLVAASTPVPIQMVEYVAPSQYELPCMGVPRDLELMMLDLSLFGLGSPLAVVSIWSGDTDGIGGAIRAHGQSTLVRAPLPFANPLAPWVDIATCTQGSNYGTGDTVGDHLLALGSDGTLVLIDQLGTVIGRKNLTTTAQGYWPFGANPHSMVVADLVPNSGLYEQEVIVATRTGLMWLHINDLLAQTGGIPTELPATQGTGYWMDVARTGGTNTHVQPRTNQTLSGAWALARRPNSTGSPGLDGKLHVLDQRGNYWRVSHGGQLELWEREREAKDARGWGYVGPVASAAAGFSGWPAGTLLVATKSTGSDVIATPWTAENGGDAVYQFAPFAWNVTNNWKRYPVLRSVFDGFLVFDRGGSVLPLGGGTAEGWMWSASPYFGWANLIEGYSIQQNSMVGTWSSVAHPATGTTTIESTGNTYLQLRSFVPNVPALTLASLRALNLSNGTSSQTVLVAGCPGGRVRIVSPGNLQSNNSAQAWNGAILASSNDLGHGGSAMAVRVEGQPGSQAVRIWYGTAVDPIKRPQQYGALGGALLDDEVAAGALHMLTWQQGSSAIPVQMSIRFHPISGRGAYGVVGLELGDLLPNAGDELVVATMSGDLIVYNIAPGTNVMTEVWRSYVQGTVGMHNSMAIADLDNNNTKELYVAGSLGLWRFTQ